MRRLAIVLAGALVVALIVAACGGSDPTAAPAPKATSAPAAPAATAAPAAAAIPTTPPRVFPTQKPVPTATAAPPPVPGEPRRGTVTVALDFFAESRVPLVTGPNQSLNAMYDPFFELDTTRIASEGTFDLVPAIISAWEPSADWKTLKFSVAKGVVAHDDWGEFNAVDVAWLINNYATDNAAQLGLDWPQVGVNAEVTDSHSITITRGDGNRFTASFVNGDIGQRLLVGPLRKQALKEGLANMAKTAVGTGPFTLVDDSPGVRIYDRIDGHWRVDPTMDELIVISSPDSSTRLALALSGQADLAKTMSEPEIVQAKGRGFQTHFTAATTGLYVFFGGSNSPAHTLGTAPWVPNPDDAVADANALKVRQAVAHAIDVDTMIEQLYGGRANRLPTVYPGASSPKFAPYAYDPDKSRQLLEEAGYDADYQITFPNIVSEGGRARSPEEVEAVDIYLRSVGMQTNVSNISGGTFYGDWNGPSGIDGHIVAFPFFGFAGAWLTMIQLMAFGFYSLHHDSTIADYYGQLVASQDIDQAAFNKTEEEAFKYIYDNYLVVPLYLIGATDVLAPDYIGWELPGYQSSSQRFDRIRFKP